MSKPRGPSCIMLNIKRSRGLRFGSPIRRISQWKYFELFPRPTTDLQNMRVPSLYPLLCILIDCIVEQAVEEPDVCRIVSLEIVMGFESVKELLPLLAKATSDIVPQPLNPRVVNTSVIVSLMF